MRSARDWVKWESAQRFLETARAVLNAKVFLIPLMAPSPLESSALVERVREIICDPELEGPLTDAAYRDDPTDDATTVYSPPDLLSVGVSASNEKGARARLEAMLLPRPPYISFHGRQTDALEATRAVSALLDSFAPRPTLFAEVDPAFLKRWIWLEAEYENAFADGFCDTAMILASRDRIALLINNGTD